MYVIKNDHRNAFKTYDGWTTTVRTEKGECIEGLQNVMRFTNNEAELNKDKLPSGSRFVYFPKIKWSDFNDRDYIEREG